MKPPSLFLLGVVLCIGGSAAGSYRYGHPLFVSENADSEGELHKRQAGESCESLTLKELCTNGFYQEYASLAVRCKDPTITASFLRDYCSLNSVGDYCYFLENDYDTAVTDICGSSPTSCTPGCRRFLTSIRAHLGCCVSIFNESSSVFANLRPFRYSLWSLCDVEPVTEQCVSSIDLTGIQFDNTCDLQTYNQLTYSDLTCRRQYVDSTRGALSSFGCGDDTYLDQIRGLCAANELGQYCQTLPLQSSRFETRASEACGDTSVCDPLCIETLNDITSAVGCCFINEFNSTTLISDELPDWMSYDFWQRCNLISPGFCEARFSEAVIFKPLYITIISTVVVVWTILK